MPYDITDPAAAHRLQLEGREKLTVAGVEDVERFDDQCIVLRTGAGVLVVSGESLHIGKLSLDGGELHVDGRIDALTYEDAPEVRGGGLFSRLFDGHRFPFLAITLSGVPETMLQTVYARAKETKTRGAITDNKAVEIIDRLDYDFSMADKDAAMHSGVIARTIVLDKLVKTYLAGHGGAVVENMACGLDTRCYRMSGYSPPDGRQPRRQTVSAAYKENAGALLLRIRQHGGPLQVPRRGEKSVSRRSFPCF